MALPKACCIVLMESMLDLDLDGAWNGAGFVQHFSEVSKANAGMPLWLSVAQLAMCSSSEYILKVLRLSQCVLL